MRPRRILGYARVSSELQGQGSSLRDQQATIAAYAKAQRHPAPTFYVESESAIHEKNERRERIRALMADVRPGDLVLCDKIDRWSRDPEFTYRSLREILAAGASFYAVGDQCDPSTPEGDTMLNFRVLFAKEEHKRIKARMVGTRKLLRDQGYYTEGLPPFGYRRALPKGHKGVEKNVLVVEPTEAEIVRRAYRLCIAGRSMTKICASLGIARDRVFASLRSRTYLGEIKNSRGEWIKGKHEAIVDADTFTKAQAALSGRKNAGASQVSETSTWILRDVARCGHCGAKMTSAYAGLPGATRRYYYRCFKRCRAKGPRASSGAYIPVRPLETGAEPLILERLEELREELGREPARPAAKTPRTDFTERRARLQRRREKYLEAFADELMSRAELRAAMAKLDASLLQLEGEEHAAKRPNPLGEEKVRRSVLREVGMIRKAWGRATPEARRKIVGHLVEVANIVAGKPCEFVWRSAEELAAMGTGS